jgi:hypothetical protein
MNTGGCFQVRVLILLLLLLLSVTISHVTAHAPLDVGSNEQLSNATKISDPQKSYVIYTGLHERNEPQYYQFSLEKGQVLSGSLQVPGPGSMVPRMVIIGPGVSTPGDVPPFVELPPGSGAKVIPVKKPGNPSFEPFTPQPVYEVARFSKEITVPGEYYIAIYGDDAGKYSLAPGSSEQFTAVEWLTIPYSVICIHMWEGQSPAGVIAPFLIIVIAGLLLLILHQKKSGIALPVPAWTGATAGLFYIGGAAVTTMQLIHAVSLTGYVPAVLLTLIFIFVPVVLGILLLIISLHLPVPAPGNSHTAMKLIVLGLLGLLFWCGFIAGPLLAFCSGLLVLVKRN